MRVSDLDDLPICPYCGYEIKNRDDWPVESENLEPIDCPNCNKEFWCWMNPIFNLKRKIGSMKKV